MMKNLVIVIALVSLLAGCRREDIREVTIEIRGLDSANRSKVVEALRPYAGVRHDSYVWDIPAGKVTVKYDSMQVAQTNLRMAIEKMGFEVVYPAKKPDEKAGY